MGARGDLDVDRGEHREHVGLKERHQRLQGVHGDEQQEPGQRQHAADGIERLDAAGEEHAGGQREDAEHHVAGRTCCRKVGRRA